MIRRRRSRKSLNSEQNCIVNHKSAKPCWSSRFDLDLHRSQGSICIPCWFAVTSVRMNSWSRRRNKTLGWSKCSNRRSSQRAYWMAARSSCGNSSGCSLTHGTCSASRHNPRRTGNCWSIDDASSWILLRCRQDQWRPSHRGWTSSRSCCQASSKYQDTEFCLQRGTY